MPSNQEGEQDLHWGPGEGFPNFKPPDKGRRRSRRTASKSYYVEGAIANPQEKEKTPGIASATDRLRRDQPRWHWGKKGTEGKSGGRSQSRGGRGRDVHETTLILSWQGGTPIGRGDGKQTGVIVHRPSDKVESRVP